MTTCRLAYRGRCAHKGGTHSHEGKFFFVFVSFFKPTNHNFSYVGSILQVATILDCRLAFTGGHIDLHIEVFFCSFYKLTTIIFHI